MGAMEKSVQWAEDVGGQGGAEGHEGAEDDDAPKGDPRRGGWGGESARWAGGPRCGCREGGCDCQHGHGRIGGVDPGGAGVPSHGRDESPPPEGGGGGGGGGGGAVPPPRETPLSILRPDGATAHSADAGNGCPPSKRRPPVDLWEDRGELDTQGAPEALCTALAVWACYLRTMPRTITGGDSGEVMAAACGWAPAHPPGYPLFVALARAAMFTLQGVGEGKAHRVNIMCSALTAAGVYHLHRAVRLVTGSGPAALAAAGMYGLSPLIWNNAVQAEVFSLNNLFVCLITHVFVRFLARERRGDVRLAYLGALLAGLGMANQHTLVFYLAVVVPSVLWSARTALLRPLPLLGLTVLFLAGLSPYCHMWLIQGCPVPWAEEPPSAPPLPRYCPALRAVPRYTWGDSRSFQGFLNHLLRRDYGTLSLAAGGAEAHGKPVSLATGLWFYGADAAGPMLVEREAGGAAHTHGGQLLYVGAPLAAAGAVLCAAGLQGRHRAAGRGLAVAWVLYLVAFHALANLPIRVPLFRAVHARFWQMPNSTLFLFLGVGYARLARRLGGGWAWALAALAVAKQGQHHWEGQDQSRTRAVDALARHALGSLPPDSILLCSGDLQLNPTLYLHVCEGVRPDVSVLSQQLMSYRWYTHDKAVRYPGVVFPGRSHWPDAEGYSMQRFFQANLPRRPIFTYGGNRPAETLERLMEDGSLHEEEFYHSPYGLLDRIVATAARRRSIHWIARDFARAIEGMERWEVEGGLPDLRVFGEDTWEEQVVREYYLAWHRFGHAAQELYRTLPGDDCMGECPDGCECERTMAVAREFARHAYGRLDRAQRAYSERGLPAPFNWDGAVELAMGDLCEEDGDAVGALWYWARYLDRKKESDIGRVAAQRKVHALREQAIGVAEYRFPLEG